MSKREDDIQELLQKYEEVKKIKIECEIIKNSFEGLFKGLEYSLQRKVNKYLLWLIGLVVTFFTFFGGYMINISKESDNHITEKEAERQYVTKRDLMILNKLSTDFIVKIVALDKANVCDSIIKDACDQYEYTNSLIWGDYGSRGIFDNETEYDRMIKHIKGDE